MPNQNTPITVTDRSLYPIQDVNAQAADLLHRQNTLWKKYRENMKAFAIKENDNENRVKLLHEHILNMADRQRKATFIEYLLTTKFNQENKDRVDAPDLLDVLKMLGITEESVKNCFGDGDGHTKKKSNSPSNSNNASPSKNSDDASNDHSEFNPLIPSITSHHASNKPVSPDAEKLAEFQEWICDLDPSKKQSFQQFNRWFQRKKVKASVLNNENELSNSSISKMTVDTSFTDIESQLGPREATNAWLRDDFAKEANFKFKKQKECIKWWDVKNRKIFEHFISQIPSLETRKAFEKWVNEDYTQAVAVFRKYIRLVKPELTKESFIKELSNLAKIVGEKLADIKGRYTSLSHLDFGYLPTQDGAEICQQWLDAQSWEWQKKFFTFDPEDVVNDVSLFILQSEKPKKKKKSPDSTKNSNSNKTSTSSSKNSSSNSLKSSTSTNNPMLKTPLIDNTTNNAEQDNVFFENTTRTSLSPELPTGKLKPLGDALQKKFHRYTLIHANPFTHKEESKVTVIYDGTVADLEKKLKEQHNIKIHWKKVKEQNNNATRLKQISDIQGCEDENGRLFSSGSSEEKPLCELLTGDYKKLLDICLTENNNIVKEYQEAHKLADWLLFMAAASGYYGEIFYTWFNFVGFAAGIKLVLEMFNIVTDKNLLFYINIGLAIAVFCANITFSPWQETNKLERKAIISQRTLFQASLYDPVSNNAFMATAFLAFAVSGVFPELIPVQTLAKDLGAYIPLAASLMGSGIPYYFFYNFDADITEQTWAAIRSIGATMHRLTGQDGNIRSVAFVEALHKFLSWLERTLRFTASTFTTLNGVDISNSINIPATVISGTGAALMSLPMRVGQIEERYHPSITPANKEKAIKAYNARWENNPLWERAMLAIDPTSSVVCGASIIIPMIIGSAVDLAPATKTPAMIALGGVIAMQLLSTFTPAAKHREINAIASRNERKAKGLPDVNTFSAVTVGIDQATRALNMIFVMQPMLPSLLDPKTFVGKMGISTVLSVEFLLIFAAYIYQSKAVDGAHRSLLEDFFETDTGKFCERMWDCLVECGKGIKNGATGMTSGCGHFLHLTMHGNANSMTNMSSSSSPNFAYTTKEENGSEMINNVQNNTLITTTFVG